jgi:hypothetical protein
VVERKTPPGWFMFEYLQQLLCFRGRGTARWRHRSPAHLAAFDLLRPGSLRSVQEESDMESMRTSNLQVRCI